MQVIGHNHHRINNKWMCGFDTAHRFSQHSDMIHQRDKVRTRIGCAESAARRNGRDRCASLRRHILSASTSYRVAGYSSSKKVRGAYRAIVAVIPFSGGIMDMAVTGEVTETAGIMNMMVIAAASTDKNVNIFTWKSVKA
jgi:hypothetical protein